jgi:hypothetical protein
MALPKTRRHACMLLMQHALAAPVEVTFQTPKEARAWRDSCYRIRLSLETINDSRFSGLKMKVKDKTLTVENANG